MDEACLKSPLLDRRSSTIDLARAAKSRRCAIGGASDDDRADANCVANLLHALRRPSSTSAGEPDAPAFRRGGIATRIPEDLASRRPAPVGVKVCYCLTDFQRDAAHD